MLHSRMHRAIMVCASVVAWPLIAAPAGVRPHPHAETQASGTSSAVTVAVGMTGLILMVPRTDAARGTELLLPNASGHVAYLGFAKADRLGCNGYNPTFRICFIDIRGWALEPIGTAGASSGRGGIPREVVNVSEDRGPRVNAAGIRSRLRSHATLLSGRVSDPCALANWEFDPAGTTPADRLSLTSYLTWEISGQRGSSLEIVLRRVDGSVGERRFTLHPNARGRIELLILHLPPREYEGVRDAIRGPGRINPPAFNSGAVTREMHSHFHAFYDAIGAPLNVRPLPTAPIPLGTVCTIRVLGLENALYAFPHLDGFERLRIGERSVPAIRAAVRTYSCIMTSADPT